MRALHKVFGDANRLIKSAAISAGLVVASAMPALAQQPTTTSTGPTQGTVQVDPDCRMDAELCELSAASDATRDYAENNYGVGILIHAGTDDFPNQHLQTVEQLGELLVAQFRQRGVDARFFISNNDIAVTGITYHVGHVIVGAENGTEVRGINDAVQSLDAVVANLHATQAWSGDLADASYRIGEPD